MRRPRLHREAVRPSVPPAGAHGGTSACSTGAALSFGQLHPLVRRRPPLRLVFFPFRTRMTTEPAMTS